MPISKISGSDAIAIMKGNAYGSWPKRQDGANRLKPMAKPDFTPSFQLPERGTIFTIGSCFARNVERALKDRGFRLPALDVLDQDEDFASVGSRVLNNYGAPSIANELRWAFEDEIDEKSCFYQTGNGWVDLHLHNTMRPTDLETLRLRRRAIRAAYRSITDCDAVIITLGLSEVWFDKETGYYLNMAPRRSMLREAPERFELHVLSFAETIAHLREVIDLIRDKGRPDVRVVLTVSPVPLTATYRDVDVMVANTYSKAVLRTAAEEIVQGYDFADYYPSYESITLSDRQVAYVEDEIHVTQEIIDLNIGRMVTAYTGAEARLTLEEIREQLDIYRARPRMGYDVLSQHIEHCAHPDVAAAFVQAALSVGRDDVAEMTMPLADDPSGMLAAMLAHARGNDAGALAAMTGKPDDVQLLSKHYSIRIRANIALNVYDAAVEAAEEWAHETPNAPAPYRVLAQALADQNDPRAEAWFERAVKVSSGNSGIALDMAEYLVRIGKRDAARARLEGLVRLSDKESRRQERLLHAV